MGADPVERACLLHEQALELRDAGRPADARRVSLRALALFEKHEGKRSPDVANMLVELAGATHDCGDYAAAIRHARRALAILKPLRGEVDFEILRARAHGQIGHSHVARGEFVLAEKANLAALAVAKAKLPVGERATYMNGLAIVYKYTARYDEAARLYKSALRTLERLGGPNHPALASILHNLGGLEHARGRFARAEPWARRGLTIRRRALGASHPDVAADAAALGAILHGTQKYQEAERLLRGAITVYERALGKQHFEVGFNLGNLAALCHETGRPEEAARLYRRSLVIKTRALGASHPDVALTMLNLATFHHSEGRGAEATKLARRALAIFARKLGRKHPQTRECADVIEALRSR
jgi:tetratricopeptide (TPR) repeat protein